MKNVSNWLSETLKVNDFGVVRLQEIRPQYVCDDGFKVSIQASEMHYCTPRVDGDYNYTEVELGFPSETVPEWLEYAKDPTNPTGTVYAYVPVEVVDKVLAKHNKSNVQKLNEELLHVQQIIAEMKQITAEMFEEMERGR